MSARGVPFHCPYCGETDLWPHEPADGEGSGHGQWECRGCLRAFSLKMLGLVRPGSHQPSSQQSVPTPGGPS